RLGDWWQRSGVHEAISPHASRSKGIVWFRICVLNDSFTTHTPATMASVNHICKVQHFYQFTGYIVHLGGCMGCRLFIISVFPKLCRSLVGKRESISTQTMAYFRRH